MNLQYEKENSRLDRSLFSKVEKFRTILMSHIQGNSEALTTLTHSIYVTIGISYASPFISLALGMTNCTQSVPFK